MNHWTIGKKLISSFLAVAAITLFLGLVGYYGAVKNDEAILEIGTNRLPSAESLLAMCDAQRTVDSAENALLSREMSLKDRQTKYADFVTALKRADDQWKIYDPLPQTPEEKIVADKFMPTAWNAWIKDHDVFVGLCKEYDKTLEGPQNAETSARANALYKKMSDQALITEGVSFDSANALLNKLIELNHKYGADATRDALAQATTLKVVNMVVMVAGVVLALLLGIFITRSLVKILTQTAESLSEGSDQVASASGQISSSSQSLAEGASEQAASLEETSASLEEIASMTKRNAENALSAKDLSSETRQAAETGSANMEEMNHAMADIQSASSNIAKIIKTIDEIAFQTNILALNAAVEAARAGEAGAGFAVVADEVRNLAQRSAQAAKETAEKIEDSISKSANGVAISGKVTESLSQIVNKARQVDELVAEIATASREQSQGIDQVNTAVTQMDKVTQTNAAAAEESASAAEELTAQAATLRELVADLQNLVTGAGQASTGPRREILQTRTTYRPQQHRAAVSAKTKGSIGTIYRPALGPSKKRNPEDEIPLEDGFRDF